jgi:pilus assembly protein CpaE
MMPDINTPTRIAAICDAGPTRQQIIDTLSAQQDFTLAALIHDTGHSGRELRAAEPEIILIDHQVGGQPTLDIIDDLAMQFPEAALVAILPDNDPLRPQQVTLAGARAFIVQPFTQVNLLSTLRRVRDLERRRAKPQVESQPKETGAQPLRTLAVYSPRGGAGCSTVAANLAVALRERTGQRVLLLEGKLFFGHLDILLNLRTHNTLADLIPHANTIDEGLVREVVTQHVSGVDVLLGPGDLQFAQGIRAQDLYSVVASLQRLYDYVIIDAGSVLNENTVTLLDLADRILLVTNPDLAALHDASRFLQLSQSLAYPPGKVLVLLNRAEIPGGVKTRDIRAALRHELSLMVPDGGAEAVRSLNRGVPLVLKYPRNPASQAFKNMARSLAGQGEPQTGRVAGNASARAKVKRQALAPNKPAAS